MLFRAPAIAARYGERPREFVQVQPIAIPRQIDSLDPGLNDRSTRSASRHHALDPRTDARCLLPCSKLSSRERVIRPETKALLRTAQHRRPRKMRSGSGHVRAQGPIPTN